MTEAKLINPFPSHYEVGPGEFVETIGLEFDAMTEGLVIEHRPGFTLLWRDALERARIAGEHAPSVTDRDIAQAAGGGEPAIQEAWILGALAAGTTRALAGSWQTSVGKTPFRTPGRDGDTVLPETEILGKRVSKSRPDQGILSRADTRGHAQGREVCRYERRFLLYKSAQGPHKRAGYV